MYCPFDMYKTMGGSMTEEQYRVYGFRAAREIDALTLGRAERPADHLYKELARANAAIAGILMSAGEARRRGAAGIASANTDGFSESYGAVDCKALRASTLAVLQECLGSDPEGLLYRGL